MSENDQPSPTTTTTEKKRKGGSEKKKKTGGSTEKPKKEAAQTLPEEAPGTPTELPLETQTPIIEPDPIPEPIITGLKHFKEISQCPIKMVTVYTDDRAEVTRVLTFSTEAIGVQDVVIDGFVPTVVEDSLRIAGGIGEATILEISQEQVKREDKDVSETQLRIKKLNELIEEKKYKKTEILDKLNVLLEEEKWVQEYSSSLIKLQSRVLNPITYDQLPKVLEFTKSHNSRIDHERVTLNLEIEEIDKEITKLEKQKDGGDTPFFKTKNQITISLDVKTTKEVSLSISYVISGASWISRYDNRVNMAKKMCVLNYLGIINNNTGEDWINVNLHLSTATPATGGSPPKLFPLKLELGAPKYQTIDSRRVQRARSIIVMKEDSATSSRRSDKSGVYDLLSSLPPPIQQMDTQVRSASGSTSVTYEIRRMVKIASDNKPHKVPIIELPYNIEFQYIVLPSKGPHAYLKAKAINNSNYRLLEGQMHVFIDEHFITTSKLQQSVPGDKINMYLGIDPGIKVLIKPVFKQETSTGFLVTKKNNQTVSKRTKIINNKNFEVTVLVYQECPFSKDGNKSIVIKREEPQPTNKSVELDSASILCWTLNIPPGEFKKTKLRYTIEYPPENAIALVRQDEKPVNY